MAVPPKVSALVDGAVYLTANKYDYESIASAAVGTGSPADRSKAWLTETPINIEGSGVPVEEFIAAMSSTADDDELVLLPSEANSDVIHGHQFLIGPTGSIERIKHGPLVSPYEDLKNAKITSLAEAVRFKRCCEHEPERIYVDTKQGPIVEDLMDLDKRVHLLITDSQVLAIVTEIQEHQPKISAEAYAASLNDVAQRYGCRVDVVRYLDAGGAPFSDHRINFDGIGLDATHVDQLHQEQLEAERSSVHMIEVSLVANVDTERAQVLIDAGRAIDAYLAAHRGGTLTASTIVDLLRGGYPQLLIGQKESQFLDVKSQQYNIDAPKQAGDRQKIELAQDVARFANGDTDAVLILGYTEEKIGPEFLIHQIREIKLADFSSDDYIKVLDARIIPAVQGLVVESIETSPGNGLIYIFVPSQPKEMQPYLVHGAVVEDKLEGSFFSIVQRRGEGSITITASQIHGYIVAGKAFLRGTNPPDL